ncbi:MAG TPA: flagellar export chaperone FliS [Bacillota bacterium]|nr:flagellar export chaperone FliS [Bacillota bacterium]
MFENGYQRYRQVQLETASPVELIIKLYDGAIRFVSLGQKALNEKDYTQANTWLLRAQDIIDELNLNLDMNAGEIAQNLRGLYNFFNRTLMDANVKKDTHNLQNVIDMLSSLRDAWSQINAEQKRSIEKKAISGL